MAIENTALAYVSGLLYNSALLMLLLENQNAGLTFHQHEYSIGSRSQLYLLFIYQNCSIKSYSVLKDNNLIIMGKIRSH